MGTRMLAMEQAVAAAERICGRLKADHEKAKKASALPTCEAKAPHRHAGRSALRPGGGQAPALPVVDYMDGLLATSADA
jgi:hypothetical protein